MRQKGIGPVLETLRGRWFTPEFAVARPDVIAARMQQVLDTDPEVFLTVIDIYAETEMAPWLGEVTAPACATPSYSRPPIASRRRCSISCGEIRGPMLGEYA